MVLRMTAHVVVRLGFAAEQFEVTFFDVSNKRGRRIHMEGAELNESVIVW